MQFGRKLFLLLMAPLFVMPTVLLAQGTPLEAVKLRMEELGRQITAANERSDTIAGEELGLEYKRLILLRSDFDEGDKATAQSFWRGELARSYLARSKPELAVPLLRTALTISDLELSPISNTSEMLSADLLKALEQSKDNNGLDVARGRVQLDEFKTKLDSLLSYTLVTDLDPSNPDELKQKWLPPDAKAYSQAESIARKRLELAEKYFPRDPFVVANCLADLVRVGHGQKKYDLADAYFSRFTEMVQKSLGTALPDRVRNFELSGRLLEISQLHLSRNLIDKAEQTCRRALHLLEIRSSPNASTAPELLPALRALGDLHYLHRSKERPTDAIEVYQRWLRIYDNNPPARRNGLATLHDEGEVAGRLGELFNHVGRYEDSIPVLKRGLQLLETHKELGRVHTTLRLGLADAYCRRGEYAAAESQVQQAQRDLEARFAKNDIHHSIYLRDIARVYFLLGRDSDAFRVLSRESEMAATRHGATSINAFNTKLYLAGRYVEHHRLAEAEAIAQQVLSLYRSQNGRLREGEDAHVSALSLQARIECHARGNHAVAEGLLQTALELTRAHPDLRKNESSILENLGIVKDLEGKYSEAEAIFNQVLTTNTGNGDDVDTLYNLASLYIDLGKFDEAEELAERPKVLDSAGYELAWAFLRQGEYARAENLLKKVRAIQDQVRVSPFRRSEGHFLQAELFWRAGNRDQAIDELAQAIDLAEDHRIQAATLEVDRAAIFSRSSAAFETMTDWQCQLGNPAKAFEAAERAKARSLLDQMDCIGGELLSGPTTIHDEQLRQRELEAQLRVAALETQLKSKVSQTPNVEQQTQADKLRQELAAARDELIVAYREVRTTSRVHQLASTNRSGPAELDAIQAWAAIENATILVYLLGDVEGFCIVISKDNPPRIERLNVSEAQAKQLGSEAGPLTETRAQAILQIRGKNIHELLAGPVTAFEALDRLAMLWTVLIPERVRNELIAGETALLAIVPDGPLTLLPFESLVVARADVTRYLLDAGPPILYAPSATVLHNLAQRPLPAQVNSKPVLTVGDPMYSAPLGAPSNRRSESVLRGQRGTAARQQRTDPGPGVLDELKTDALYTRNGGSLSRLAYSGWESEWVEQHYAKGGAKVHSLRGQNATEAGFRALAVERQVLHLACHGLADQHYGNFFAALALTPGPNALLDPSDDGFLTLPEIYELNLAGCELAILSACQTNSGPQHRGEGVWALSRAFLVAGSRRVVATNWSVNDEASATLVSYFCSILNESQKNGQRPNYAAALHRAKQGIRKNERWSSPYFWVPFVLVGPR